MITDEGLFAQYLSGDDRGLSELIEKYGNSLIFYINRYVHNLHDAEDLMIEAFAYLTIKKPRIRDGCFKAYLYKTARNLAIRMAMKNRLRHCFSLEDIKTEPVSSTLIEEILQIEERDQTLHRCMHKLKPDYREALYLVYFKGMRHAQAAKVMGRSEKQVSDLIYRGRKSLRKYLEEEGIIDAKYG